jgi:SAM-dependent methyltransferase
MQIKSPLTNNLNIKKTRDIPTDQLIQEYKKANIDVAKFFAKLSNIKVYECLDTGYQFYYPFNLEGDDQFYQDLQQFDWYYFDWKWEYDKALEQIKPGEKVLEIGCGPGDFLAKLKDKNCECTGLEFNAKALKKSREKGLTVLNETIQKHAGANIKKYDIVCSFQVMEHISEIGDAIKASLKVLKPGGKLLISVPNDDSIINRFEDNLLNMPPHHMGIWNEKSLRSLPKFFPLELDNIYIEPLQKYHYKQYFMDIFGKKIHKIFGKLAFKLNIIPRKLFFYMLEHMNLDKHITGHAIIAVYTKKMKKKSVIILDHSGGILMERRLANQLWMIAAVYAYCLDKGYKFKNYSFYNYYKFFRLPVGNFLVKLLFFNLYCAIQLITPNKLHRSLSYYHRRLFRLFVDRKESKSNNILIAPDSDLPEKHYLPPSNTRDKIITNFDNNNNKNLYLDGWMFRNPEGLKKYRKEIIEFLKAKNEIQQEIDNFITPVRKKYKKIIGIHYRQGDYKRWQNGKYYLKEAEINNNIQKFIKKFDIETNNTCFVVCSDNSVKLDSFSGLNIIKSKFTEDVYDLFLLSSTDKILGSNSTFGAFASYYGNIPMIVMQKGEVDWKYYKDKNNYFEDKYCTNVWY